MAEIRLSMPIPLPYRVYYRGTVRSTKQPIPKDKAVFKIGFLSFVLSTAILDWNSSMHGWYTVVDLTAVSNSSGQQQVLAWHVGRPRLAGLCMSVTCFPCYHILLHCEAIHVKLLNVISTIRCAGCCDTCWGWKQTSIATFPCSVSFSVHVMASWPCADIQNQGSANMWLLL